MIFIPWDRIRKKKITEALRIRGLGIQKNPTSHADSKHLTLVFQANTETEVNSRCFGWHVSGVHFSHLTFGRCLEAKRVNGDLMVMTFPWDRRLPKNHRLLRISFDVTGGHLGIQKNPKSHHAVSPPTLPGTQIPGLFFEGKVNPPRPKAQYSNQNSRGPIWVPPYTNPSH